MRGSSQTREDNRRVQRLLYFLRHAKSDWDDASLPDHARPLNGRGRRSAVEVAATLTAASIAPDLVLVSSAERTRQTVAALSDALPAQAELAFEDGLYGASATELLGRVRQVDDARASVLVIGHNPGIEELAAALVRPAYAEQLADGMRTASLVGLSFEGSWSEIAPRVATLVGRWEHPGEKH
jgi:phosphohistidine phosphatase